MNTITYRVPSIMCMHCVHTIKTELGDLEGVNAVDVKMEDKTVTISYEAPATEEKIEALLAEINYPVEK